jgi:hypothetical protein
VFDRRESAGVTSLYLLRPNLDRQPMISYDLREYLMDWKILLLGSFNLADQGKETPRYLLND